MTEEAQPASASGNTSSIKIFFIFGIISSGEGNTNLIPTVQILTPPALQLKANTKGNMRLSLDRHRSAPYKSPKRLLPMTESAKGGPLDDLAKLQRQPH